MFGEDYQKCGCPTYFYAEGKYFCIGHESDDEIEHKTDDDFEECMYPCGCEMFKHHGIMKFNQTCKKHTHTQTSISNQIKNKWINVRDALKIWMGSQYDEKTSFEMYEKFKEKKCSHIFFRWSSNGGGLFDCIIDFENDRCDRKYFEENTMMFKPKNYKICTTIMRDVVFEEDSRDIGEYSLDDVCTVPYEGKKLVFVIAGWKNK